MFSQGYLIDSQVCIAVLYLLYVTLLAGRISHRAARAYILSATPLGLLIPLIKLPLLPAVEVVAMDLEFSTDVYEGYVSEPYNPINYILLAYLAGVAVMTLWLMLGAVKIFFVIRKSRIERIEELRVIFARQKLSAYSVFSYIFINKTLRNSDLLTELLAHERCHIRMRHTLDLVYMSALRAIFWFNPLVWHTGILLKRVHEYQVDESVLNQGYSAKRYIDLLILSEAGISPEFASPLSYSLTKKRLKMLAKQKRATDLRRLLFALPVVAMLLGAFSLTTRAQDTKKENPLIVVDGKEFEGDANKVITPTDVESISVLKDNEAKEIYGDKGKNGVIVITSKIKPTLFSMDNPSQPQPLYILDNSVVALEQVRALKEDEIASISILKDESATNTYGEKAKNGVILIETKAGLNKPHTEVTVYQNKEKKVFVYYQKSKQLERFASVEQAKAHLRNIDAQKINYEQEREITLITTADADKPMDASKTQNNVAATLFSQDREGLRNLMTLTPVEQEVDVPVIKADVMPKFQGGSENDFRNWVMQNIAGKYHKEAADKGIQGTVIVQFIVEKDGSLSNVKVLRSLDKSLDNLAVETIKSSPGWTPGTIKGRPVRVSFTIPVRFGSSGGDEKAQPTKAVVEVKKSDGGSEEDVPVIKAEIMPLFEGGSEIKFREWTQNGLHYPKEAVDNGIQGQVIVKFVVERDGSVSNVSVLRSVDEKLDKVAVEKIKSSPKWTPGSHKGKPVRVTFTVPVVFRLQ